MNHRVNYIEPYHVENGNDSITAIYRNLMNLENIDFVDRVVHISEIFLGQPYILGACGEGPKGDFDQAPLCRFDGFDCVTYVNAVLALAMSQDLVSFQKNLVRIGYRNSQIQYSHRHHFMSVDWNPSNQALGLVKDITSKIVNANGNSVAEYADALIDRPEWFRHRTYNDIRLLKKVPDNEEILLLKKMHGIADAVQAEKNHLPYLPLSQLFDNNGNLNDFIFEQIPQGAIVEVVRPNWDLKEKIGTNLNVSHIGFAIWKEGILYYRQASSIEKRVCDISMVDYFYHRLLSPSIKGINIQALVSNFNN